MLLLGVGCDSVGTSCEKRFGRADEEGLLLLLMVVVLPPLLLVVPVASGVGAESLRSALNHGLVDAIAAEGDGVDEAGAGTGECECELWELVSRDRMWVWV